MLFKTMFMFLVMFALLSKNCLLVFILVEVLLKYSDVYVTIRNKTVANLISHTRRGSTKAILGYFFHEEPKQMNKIGR